MKSPPPFRLLVLILLAALAGSARGLAAESAQLTVGQGWAWVREFFPPSGEREIDQIVWDQPPPQIDLETLQVWNVRRPWPIREWRWVEAKRPPPPPASEPRVWHPKEGLLPPPAHDTLEIQLASPLSHAMGHSLTYRIPDFNWEAQYRLTVRGIGRESIDAVQVDLTAYLSIQNGNAKAYPAARVSLVGVDESLQPPPKPFGLLALNPNTALTDLWLASADSPDLHSAIYPLETEAAIPAHGEAKIQFARVRRKPAQIIHICDSDEIPQPTPRGGMPLQRALLIPNTERMGLGFPLPPGQADLFLGTMRGAPVQSGHILHTPFPGILELDMGQVDSVRASRVASERVPLPEGAWQQDYSVTLINRLDSPVQIQVAEKPDTPLQWDLVRSSVPCEETTRELHFDVTVPPQSIQTITYRLRMRMNAKP